MKRNLTHSLIYCVLTVILAAFTATTKSQVSLQFSRPQLISGTDGAIGATYKFSNVTSGTDAYVTIENIVGSATLKNIDDTTTGYYNAWQPVVTSPGSVGSSYIKWDVEFKDKSGNAKSMLEVDATGIDIDGDGYHIREFTMINGLSTYNLPSQVSSVLAITNETDTDNVKGTDASSTNLKALGPVSNRTNIDTVSQDVQIGYVFLNISGFKYYTGSTVDQSYSPGSSSLNRYNSIYFQKIVGSIGVLKINYQDFNAFAGDNHSINLSWLSDADNNGGHFEIEKAYNPDSFSTMAVLLGAESMSGNMGYYKYTDNSSDNASHNIIYYRLKMIDASGTVSYSQTISVKLNNATISNSVVKVFPNPYMERINVSFDSKEAGATQILLCNASGTIVKKLNQQAVAGSNTFTINNLSQQSAGVYFLNVSVNGKVVESKKIMKL